MAARKKVRESDIRLVFDRLSDDALLDDAQLGQLAGRAAMTIKRWRREGKTPPCVSLNGAPRFRVGDIKPWLRGTLTAHSRAHPSRIKIAMAFGDDALATSREAADFLNKSESTLESWRAKGVGPPWVKIGERAVAYPIGGLKTYTRRGEPVSPACSRRLDRRPSERGREMMLGEHWTPRAAAGEPLEPHTGPEILEAALQRSTPPTPAVHQRAQTRKRPKVGARAP
jgi:predicted DNA-binding transcriptional regulator AlpA